MTRIAPRGRGSFSRLLLVAALGAGASCGDSPQGPKSSDTTGTPVPSGVIVSSPTPLSAIASAQRTSSTSSSRTIAAAPEPQEVSYVSLPPGTVADGAYARIERVGGDAPVITSVRDGGFDPVPINVFPTDTVEVLITSRTGALVFTSRIAIRPTRPPAIVRSYPPGKKTDVAINSSVVVVFSEPIDASTISASSIQLSRGNTNVSGTIRVLPGGGNEIAFTPSVSLAANTDYTVAVSRTVQNKQGQALPNDASLSFRTGTGTTGAIASVLVLPDSVFLGDATYQMSALVQDAAGNVLVDVPVTWSAPSTYAVNGLTVSSTGLITPHAEGGFEIVAEAGGVTGGSAVVVKFPNSQPATVTITPSSKDLPPDGTVTLDATVFDAAGRPIQRDVTWSSSDPSVARLVDSLGGASNAGQTAGIIYTNIVRAIAPGTTTITLRSEGAAGTAIITVTPRLILPVTFGSVVAAGAHHTCALDVVGAAYCWGISNSLGDGTPYSSPVPVRVAGGLAYSRLSAWSTTCGLLSSGESYCWDIDTTYAPVRVASDMTFSSIALGWGGDCALTASGAAFCWGTNGVRGGGDPSPVAGELRFRALSVGEYITCGLTFAGTAYCWGEWNGQDHPVPEAVPGGLTFASLSASYSYACGLTTDGAAYCWGVNEIGQLGDGTKVDHWTPAPVAGGHSFSVLAAARFGACAIDTSGAAYCWGQGLILGNGGTATSESLVPAPVAGNLTFKSLSVTYAHVCGLTTGSTLYCWGSNGDGQLGDGTKIDRSVPTKVVGQP